ncbi:MAG: ATP phosphoribosyltransferase [Polyangiales bacterium]
MPETAREAPAAPRPLVCALPKGRVLKQLLPLLSRAGLPTEILQGDDRALIREDPQIPLRFILLKPDDVPTYVDYGAADLGVVGRDVLWERGYDLYAPVELGVGRCRLVVAGVSTVLPDPALCPTLRVATKFPALAADHFRRHGRSCETIFVQGSVELAPLVGLADVIVDLVESGETLRQNGLSEIATITSISSVVVVNRAALKLHGDRVRPLLAQLRAAAAAT